MKTRISHLHKQESDWSKFSTWIPEAGEFIIYDPDDSHNYSRLKVGDGKRPLEKLDFLIDSALDKTLQSQQYFKILDGGRITDKII